MYESNKISENFQTHINSKVLVVRWEPFLPTRKVKEFWIWVQQEIGVFGCNVEQLCDVIHHEAVLQCEGSLGGGVLPLLSSTRDSYDWRAAYHHVLGDDVTVLQ